MGCCVSKKRDELLPGGVVGEEVEAPRLRVEARDPPPTEEEKVKEVLSETPTASARARPRQRLRRVDGAVARSVERGGEKVPRGKGGGGGGGGGGGRVRDGSRARRAVGVERATSEKSEAASESSVATTATGPERSPGKPARKRAVVSGELGRARRDRGPAVPGACRPGGGLASPSPTPPPRREPGERPNRRSPSPAAKRPLDQRHAAASCPQAQRKPPVPPRPGGRASTRRAQETPLQVSPASSTTTTTTTPSRGPPPHPASPPPPPPQARAQEAGASATGGGDVAGADGDGKESLDNPSVAMECFIFL